MNSRIPQDKSNKVLRNTYGKNLTEQNNALEEMLKYVRNLSVAGKKKSRRYKFSTGITVSILSLQQLYHYLRSRYGVDYILTHRLNQDVLENLFSQVRGLGRMHDNPNSMEFRYRLRTLLLSKTRGEIAASSNSTPDDSSAYVSADVFSSGSACKSLNLVRPLPTHRPFRVPQTLQFVPEDDVVHYIAGFVARKLRATHRYLGSPTSDSHEATWASYKSDGGLLEPAEDWFQACLQLECHFKHRCAAALKQEGTLKDLVDTAIPIMEKKFPKTAVVLYLKTRLYARVKFLNEQFRQSRIIASTQRKLAKF